MKIKVCGLTDPQNINEVATLAPDYMGFIFYKPSPRYVNDLTATSLSAIPKNINKTAVFVNETEAFINEKIEQFGFDAIQLHGDESAEFCSEFNGRVKVIKAFGLDEDFDFDKLKTYRGVVDHLLFDTKTKVHGGSGQTFDWDLLNNYDLNVPFFLSGGINLENLEVIKRIEHPQFYGVDLNSRFETAPGVKNIIALKQAFDLISEKYTNELRS